MQLGQQVEEGKRAKRLPSQTKKRKIQTQYFASDAAIAPLSGNIFFAKNHGIVFPKRKSAQDVATVIFVHWWIRQLIRRWPWKVFQFGSETRLTEYWSRYSSISFPQAAMFKFPDKY